MPVLLGEDRSETLLLRDGNEQWLECGDYTHRTCNWSLKMKTDDPDPRVEQTVSGTPRDYSEDLYSLYFELIDVDGTAERPRPRQASRAREHSRLPGGAAGESGRQLAMTSGIGERD
jgi:hypothetical protein